MNNSHKLAAEMSKYASRLGGLSHIIRKLPKNFDVINDASNYTFFDIAL